MTGACVFCGAVPGEEPHADSCPVWKRIAEDERRVVAELSSENLALRIQLDGLRSWVRRREP